MQFEIEKLLAVAIRAGDAIMEVYNDADLSKQATVKSDDSPLTLADQRSHEIIVQALPEIAPSVPVLSEEGAHMDYEERKKWDTFWLVDPLDGTKEFINRNGEFTVNIALIEQKKATLGIIYVPAQKIMYYGIVGSGAFKKVQGEDAQSIKVNDLKQPVVAVKSKSHASQADEDLLAKLGVSEYISVGSSLKFCMVAEGKADVYYRHGPTMEWDTAAGQAIVSAAGGQVFQGNETKELFAYNKENLRNGSFLCTGYQL